jgi:phage terminase small subunit
VAAKKARGPRPLTERARRFVVEYIVDLNATQAAIRAGYSPNGAAARGCELLGNPLVQAEVQAALARRQDRTELRADLVLLELGRVAMSDIGDLVDPATGKILALDKMPLAARRAVASIENEELVEGSGENREHVGTLRKLKLWDKTNALTTLARHFKLLTDKVEVKREFTLEEIILGRVLGE